MRTETARGKKRWVQVAAAAEKCFQQQPCERGDRGASWGGGGGSKVVMFGRDLGCVAGVRAVGRKG